MKRVNKCLTMMKEDLKFKLNMVLQCFHWKISFDGLQGLIHCIHASLTNLSALTTAESRAENWPVKLI